MNSKLKWKQKWCDDKSGYWYSAKIPVLGWEYIIDVQNKTTESQANSLVFIPGIYYSKLDDDVTLITNKKYLTYEKARLTCENHLIQSFKKFQNWISRQ